LVSAQVASSWRCGNLVCFINSIIFGTRFASITNWIGGFS
jgi:hypothetical protein